MANLDIMLKTHYPCVYIYRIECPYTHSQIKGNSLVATSLHLYMKGFKIKSNRVLFLKTTKANLDIRLKTHYLTKIKTKMDLVKLI